MKLSSKSIIASSLFTCISLGASQVYAVDTLAKIKSSGKIIIGFSDTSMPISYIANGKADGYAIDICRHVASDVKRQLNMPNLRIEYLAVTPSQRIPDIKSGRIDMACESITNSYKRQQEVAFSTNFYYTEVRMAVKKGANIHNISDLDHKAVVTTAGTTSDQYVKRNERGKNIDVINLYGRDMDDSFAILANGKAEAFVMDDNILAGLIAKSSNPGAYAIVGPVLSAEPYGIMLPKGDSKFKEVVDGSVNGLWKSGEMRNLYKKWFQSPIPPKNINLDLDPSRSYLNLQRRPTDAGI
ncbi:amino acid ABC transporter substrate-binding protein [Acinetobacter sp. MB5]|uniref:amino acid ABC transporter substrate-binding protein n=1 Tax=Acinetobacter sp. MB5 TaxID=2069438 RepID=UPI000DD08678|nr:amino acid ABC transporter substrate-binding protein [Acinetobacter sp. MB5]